MDRRNSNSWLKHWDFILIDLFLLQAAYLVSCMIRNGGANPYSSPLYLNTGLVLVLADICTAFFMESYRGIMRRGYFQEFKAAAGHVAIVCALEMLFLFLSKRGNEFSRLSFLAYAAMSVLLVYLGRVFWKWYLLKHERVVYQKRAVLVVTTSDRAEHVLKRVERNTYNELFITGVILLDRDDLVGREIAGIRVVCRLEEMLDYIQTRWLDSVLISLGPDGPKVPEGLAMGCVQMGVTVHRTLLELGQEEGNQQLDQMGGYAVISTTMKMASQRQLFFKRALDICGGLVGCLMTLLITVIIGPAIYLASPGPIFFSQVRIGQNGRKFKIYKFRSMYMDAEKRKKELMARNEMSGFMFKLEADPRIIGSGPDGTRHGLGWFIRKTSLDEFPQFWNVLKGDMSLVGTRPPTVDEWEKYEHHHRARMAAKPGITGMWQVSGRSDITDFEEVVRLDTEYIRKWNVGLDLRILFKTVLVVALGRGSK